MILYAACPLFVIPFFLYLNFHPPNLLSILVTSSLEIQIFPGPVQWIIFALRFIPNAIITLDGSRMLAFFHFRISNISGFSTLIIASTFQTQLLQIIENSTNFTKLHISLEFYDRLRINFQHGRIMMMNIFALFFFGLFLFGTSLAFCRVKLHGKFPWQFSILAPTFFGMTCAVGDVAIPILINCAKVPVEWLKRVKIVVGGWSGPRRAWGKRIVKSRQTQWVVLGVGDVKLYGITSQTKSATLFLIIDYTITLLLSINV